MARKRVSRCPQTHSLPSQGALWTYRSTYYRVVYQEGTEAESSISLLHWVLGR
jgi:hypothetical protein